MSLAVIVKIAEVVGITLGTIAFALMTYWKLKERAIMKEHGLEDNPERCGRHEEQLKSLSGRIDKLEENNREDHQQIFRQIGDLAVEIAKVSRGGEQK